MKQVVGCIILFSFLIIKNADAGVLFYFFSGHPTQEVVTQAKSIQERCNVKIIGVIKGLLKGEELISAVKRLNKYQKEGFEIWIDPTLYDLFGIYAIPCFVLVPDNFAYSRICIDENKIRIKKICGNLSIQYVLRRFQACKPENAKR